MIEKRKPTRAKWLYTATLCALLAVIGWLVATRQPDPPRNQVSVPAAPAAEVRGEIKQATPIKTGHVKTYRPAIKASLSLPGHVVQSDTQQVIAASQIKASDRPKTITTVIDTDTGEATQYEREDPLPWLAWDTRGEAGLYLGLKNGEKAARLEVRQGVLAIKAAHIGLIASADQPLSGPLKADAFIGAGVWMRW